MAQVSSIQWTDATWNIARGCTKVDEDCKFCYMYRDSFDSHRYNPLEVVRTKTVFDMPLRYKETKSAAWPGNPLIFTSSLTDFFHEAIDGYRNEAWDIIRKCPHLTFQILTKRPERIAEHLPTDWGKGWDNVWFGTSVGSQKGIHRIAELVMATTKKPLKTIFLSLEPLHGELIIAPELLKHFDWVIVGGESGNDTGKYRYRPCELKWIEHIVSDCRRNNIPVFVKQIGTWLSKQLKMTDRHGGNIDEFPEHLQVRQFPLRSTTRQ